MANKKDFALMEHITQLHSEGLNDSQISRKLNIRGSRINYYRFRVLKLETYRPRREYGSEQDKLKGYIIRNIKSSARIRGLDFNLSIADIILPTNCPIMDTPLSFKSFLGLTDHNNLDQATIDRIDSGKGYVKGNIWIISRLANNMKSCATQDQLITFSKSILKLTENQRALGGITDSVSLGP
jgi:hypothetical protein